MKKEKENKIIECTCGMQHMVQTKMENSKITICSNCHPFYTGKERKVDSEGRVEKFNKKYGIGKDKK